jgi:predicted dehydrogenase
MAMTTEQQVSILAVITTSDEAGKHFAEVYDHADLTELEADGLLTISRSVHATGIAYSQEYWSVQVTEDGIELVEANPEYCPEV